MQIQARGCNSRLTEQIVDLPPVVGLVIKEVGNQQSHGVRVQAALMITVAQTLSQKRFGQTHCKGFNLLICLGSSGLQLSKVIVQNLIEAGGRDLISGKAAQPDTVAHQNMIERAVNTFEKSWPDPFALRIIKLVTSRIDLTIGQSIVPG